MTVERDLGKLFKWAIWRAQNVMLETGKCLPTWTAVTQGGPVHVYVSAWKDEQEKARVLSATALAFALHRVQRYVFCCETWHIHANTLEETKAYDEWHKANPAASFTEYPGGCTEKLTVLGVSHSERIHATFTIVRDEDKKVTALKREEEQATVVRTGRLYEMLPPAGYQLPFHLKKLAKKVVDAMMVQVTDLPDDDEPEEEP